MRMKAKKRNKNYATFTLLAVVAAVLMAAAFLLSGNKNNGNETLGGTFGAQDALTFALDSAEGRQFVSANPEYQTAISARSTQELREISLSQPVIYGNLSGKNIFEVRLESTSGAGLLMVVSEKGVEKVFAIRNVELRGS